MTKEIICTICPIGCCITVVGENDKIESVEGNTCKRGEKYAVDEFIHPVRILTSTIKVEKGKNPLVAVRSNQPVPKELLLDCMQQIKKTVVSAPVKRGDILIHNILDTGIDIIATGQEF